MSKKQEFIKYVNELMENCPNIKPNEEANMYWEVFCNKVEDDKPLFTDNGKLILQYMRDHQEAPMWKARDIAEGLFINSRAVSGAMRKLVTDGFIEKERMGNETTIYSLTEIGKNIEIN